MSALSDLISAQGGNQSSGTGRSPGTPKKSWFASIFSGRNRFTLLTYPYIGWLIAMVVVPMLLIVFYAFTTAGNDVVMVHFTFDHFVNFLSDEKFMGVVGHSLLIAFITTMVCIVLGYPIAYIISRMRGNKSLILILLLTLPTWINMLVRTYAWMGILQKGGLLPNLLTLFGAEDKSLLYTDFAVMIGMVYNFLPFMILQIHSSLAKMDNSLLEAAADLGANKVQSFLRVTLPLSLPGVVSGITLVFLPAVSSFFIPRMLGGGQYTLVGNLIEDRFLKGNWNFGSAVSLIMAIIMIFTMWLTRKLDFSNRKES